jgi:hypothetical protein
MLRLHEWPFSRILILAALWISASLVFMSWQLYRQYALLQKQHQDADILAVTFSVPVALLVLLGPPLLLAFAWYVACTLSRGSS